MKRGCPSCVSDMHVSHIVPPMTLKRLKAPTTLGLLIAVPILVRALASFRVVTPGAPGRLPNRPLSLTQLTQKGRSWGFQFRPDGCGKVLVFTYSAGSRGYGGT